MDYRIKLSPPESSGKEKLYLKHAIDSNELSMFGSALDKFRNQLQTLTGSSELLLTSSGTSALHLALKVLGVREEDSVICPTFTYVASANPIKYVGANPIFIDSEKDTWNMDPILLEQYLSSPNPQIPKSPQLPKAIIAVHIYSMPSRIQEIVEIGNKYNIPVIEDAAEAIGTKIYDKHVGTFGDIGVLSFNGNKIITTSGGGALLSKNSNLIQQAVKLASQAKVDVPWYEHNEVGYNYQMGNINAAVGLGQLEDLSKRIIRRREIFDFYKSELEEFGVSFQSEPKGYYSNRWLTCILFDSFEQRENARLTLESNGIESRPLWKPMHQQPVFEGSRYFGGRVAEDLFEKGLCLPSGGGLGEGDLEEIVRVIKSSLGQRTSVSPKGEGLPDRSDLHYGASPILFAFAKELRKRETLAESLLWERVKAKNINGIKFRRQHPIHKYIADFYSHEIKYVIEVDGDYHNEKSQAQYDFKKDGELNEYGVFVRRIRNESIINNMESVLNTILEDINQRKITLNEGGYNKSSFRRI